MTAKVSVPAEVLEPGPRGARLHVVDYDAATGTLELPVVIGDDDPFADGPLDVDGAHVPGPERLRDRGPHAGDVRGGPRPPGAVGLPRPPAVPVPRAFPELNAYYSPEDGAIFFGYLPLDGGAELQTCLSHDVVAHETTHAVLDGLRPRLAEPGLPDQPAFHEALADIVALLSVFSLAERRHRLLGKPDAQGRLKPARAHRGRAAALGAVRARGGARHGDGRGARQRAAPLDRPRAAPTPGRATAPIASRTGAARSSSPPS